MALEKQIEELKKDDSKALAKVEKIVENSCKAITRTKSILLKLNVNNINQIKELEKDVNAHYIILEEWYQKISSLKKNKELAYYMYLKNKLEAENAKFVSASADKESALYTAPERKLRDKVLGSLNGATEVMKTCRNIINSQKFASQTSEPDTDVEA